MAINDKLLKGAAAAGGGLVPSANFQTVIYTGTGASQSFNIGFAPDFVFIKKRNAAKDWQVVDTVRNGVTGSTGANILYTNLVQGQDAGVGKVYFSSFNSDGFTLGGNDYYNGSDQTYVAYCWRVPDTFSHSASGSQLASTGKSNQAAGFSIVSYTGNNSSGATVKHNLDATPEMMIVKRTDTSGDWDVFTTETGRQKYLILGTTQSVLTASNIWNDTAPTNSVFTIGNHASVNASNGTYISYCFKSIAGYSKVGSYTGTGANQHIDCGFEPAWVMIKNTENTYRWYILDNKRNKTNPKNARLFINSNAEEATNADILDFTTTGFQIITSDAEVNQDTKKMIFLAFAADPDTTTPTVAKSFAIQKWTGNGAVSHIGRPIRFGSSVSLQTIDSSQIELNSVINRSVFQSDVSVSMWVQTNTLPDSTSSEGAHAFTVCDGGWGIQLSTSKTRFTLYTSGGAQAIDFPALEAGYWYHLCASFDRGGAGMRFWVTKDGEDAIGTALTNSYSGAFEEGSQDGVGFGAYNDYDDRRGFGGLITQARIYTQSLTDAQAGKLYLESVSDSGTQNPSTSGFPSNCLALYRFQGNANAVPTSKNGVGTGDTYITNSIDFKPDLLIIKNIVAAVNNQNWYWADTVRGEHMQLRSDGSGSDNDDSPYGVTSFNDAGFSVSDVAAGNNNVNGAVGGTYSKAAQFIAYSFKMLDNNNNVPIENTVGTIDSLTSVNAAAGMSIAKYTGNGTEDATIGHGLSSVPNLVIIKCLSSGESWFVAHSSLAANNFLELQSTAAATNIAALNYDRLATTFKTTGSSPHAMINASGKRYIMYSFITTSSFSKFGSYEGNQNTGVNNQVDFGSNMSGVDFVMIKNADAANSQWMVFDSERTNGMAFYMNTTAPESSYIGDLTISSQGLRFGSTNINVNRANETYIYWAMKIN